MSSLLKLRLPPRPERMISGKGVFMVYLMLKNQMQGKYDVIKYNWGIKVSDAAFNKRRDKYFFNNLSQKFNLGELVHLFTSNLVMNQNAWIGEIADADAMTFYREQKGRLLRMKDIYTEDIKSIVYFAEKVNVPLKEIFEYNKNTSTSYVFKLLQSQLISFETFLILDSFLDIINNHDKASEDLVWSSYSTKLNGLKKLMYINRDLAKQMFVETVKNNRSLLKTA